MRHQNRGFRTGTIGARAALLLAALAMLWAPWGGALGAEGPAESGGAPVYGANAPADFPAGADLTYRTTAVMMLGGLPLTLHATTTTRWQRDAMRYDMHLHTDTVEFTQFSSGQIASDGALIPDRYSEKRPFHDTETVVIDWTHRHIRFGAAAPAQAPPPGAQDRLSLQFTLARLRRQFPERFPVGSVYAAHLIGPRDVDLWNFVVTGDDTIETGRGPMRTTHFAARRSVNSVEETMDLWLGADVYWMPVRIRMVDRKQSVIDSVLQKAELRAYVISPAPAPAAARTPAQTR